jgi:hypothetical protein
LLIDVLIFENSGYTWTVAIYFSILTFLQLVLAAVLLWYWGSHPESRDEVRNCLAIECDRSDSPSPLMLFFMLYKNKTVSVTV